MWSGHPIREGVICASKADLVIMCMGLNPGIEGEEGEEPTEPWTEATYATTSTFVDLTKLENRVVTQNGIAKGWTPEFSAAISNYQMQFRLLFSSFTYV